MNQSSHSDFDTNATAITLSDAEWKNRLTENEYYILRQKGTEQPYTGKFLLHKEQGNYTCKGCGAILFDSESKFDSHCGWPSFDKEIAKGRIKETIDKSHGMIRTEITCARCGGHLGHVFTDGPTKTGLRYCVNSVSIDFAPADSDKSEQEVTTLGGGCFWCIEAVFQQMKGIQKVESGYMGGNTKNPSYRDVCSGNTGHAEVVQITYDKNQVSFAEILKVFFTVHDPTTLNQQGNDIGTQYRSAIFYTNEQQKNISTEIISALNNSNAYDKKIVTQVQPAQTFYKAEAYHQNYYNQNKEQGYCRYVIQPKLEKFEKVFADKIKKN